MARAVTWIVTVTVPPGAIVTEPAKVLPVKPKLPVAVLALALTWLLTPASVLVSWLGKLSLRVPVSVPGPLLVTTMVKLVVPPSTSVLLATTLVTPRVTTGTTPITAETVDEFVPTEVVSEPGAIVLVTVPPTELVTTTEIVQVDAWGIKVAAGKVKEPKPGVAEAMPALQPVVATDDGAALTKPVG